MRPDPSGPYIATRGIRGVAVPHPLTGFVKRMAFYVSGKKYLKVKLFSTLRGNYYQQGREIPLLIRGFGFCFTKQGGIAYRKTKAGN